MKIQFAALLVLFAAADARRSPAAAPPKRAFVRHSPYSFGLDDPKEKVEVKHEKVVKEVKNGESYYRASVASFLDRKDTFTY